MADTVNDNGPDILARLEQAAAYGSGTPEHLIGLLLEAAEIIVTLRTLVGIRKEIELEDEEPQGRA